MPELGVIFDVDGVLVDSYRAHFESWRRMAHAVGLEMDEQQFAATFGRTSQDIIRQLWGKHLPPGTDVVALDDLKEAAYRDILRESFPAMDGASELLAALHRAGFRLAVGSSGPPENVELVIQQLHAERLFQASVNGKQVTHGKPHPEVFLTAAEKLGLAAGQCAVVEDAPAGIEAARRAGMAAIALTGTAERGKLAQRAHLVVDSLRDLSPRRIAKLIEAVEAGDNGAAPGT
jgi:beta-phosphoglucomutase